MYLPKEPDMLLSFINMKLRDQYSSLEDMCDDLMLDSEEIYTSLRDSNLYYDAALNQIKSK